LPSDPAGLAGFTTGLFGNADNQIQIGIGATGAEVPIYTQSCANSALPFTIFPLIAVGGNPRIVARLANNASGAAIVSTISVSFYALPL
jgi:hypothetical protein